jgi:hypothetical protein
MFMLLCVPEPVCQTESGNIQQAKIAVDERAGTFDCSEGHDDFFRHALGRNMEVFERTLRLRAPQPVGRNLNGAERIMFFSGDHGIFPMK